ncbi:MAG: helix-turn-helix transcriptional regulator [Acetatifactor sp.]
MVTVLKQLRSDNNTSQQQLADIAGVSIRTLSRYENGTQIPPVDTALRIAAYYNLLVEDIFRLEKNTIKP